MNNSIQSVLVTGTAFVVGLLAGGATGLLLAPHSGSHTRRQLRSLADGIGEHVSHIAEEATEAGSHTRRQLRSLGEGIGEHVSHIAEEATGAGSHTRRQLRSLGEGIGEHASRMAAEASEAVNEVIKYGKCLTR